MNEQQKKEALENLSALFPDERDKRLVSDLLFLRSATEDLRSFGSVSEEILTLRRKDADWKLRLIQDLVDSLTWVNRLTGVYVQALTGLYIHLRRELPQPAPPVQQSLTQSIESIVP